MKTLAKIIVGVAILVVYHKLVSPSLDNFSIKKYVNMGNSFFPTNFFEEKKENLSTKKSPINGLENDLGIIRHTFIETDTITTIDHTVLKKEQPLKAVNEPAFDIGKHFNNGLTHLSLKDYENAVKAFDKVIESDPTYLNVYLHKGISQHYLEQYKDAIKTFEQSIRLRPSAQAYSNQGLAYHRLKEYQNAIAAFDSAIQLDANHSGAYMNKGIVYSDLKKYNKAIENYDSVIQLTPDYAPVYMNRGIAYAEIGNKKQTIEDINRAVELDTSFTKKATEVKEYYTLK